MRLSLRRAAAPTESLHPSTRQLADPELLERLRAGDSAALESALAQHWGSVVDYVRRLTSSADTAEDIAQRAFCQLWDRRAQWRPAGSLRALLCKIARNYAISEYRREIADGKSALVFTQLGESLASMDDRIEGEQLREALDRQIAALPARRREILVLRCVHDLSYKEIADVMNIAPQTVANQLCKAIATLRDSLGSALD